MCVCVWGGSRQEGSWLMAPVQKIARTPFSKIMSLIKSEGWGADTHFKCIFISKILRQMWRGSVRCACSGHCTHAVCAAAYFCEVRYTVDLSSMENGPGTKNETDKSSHCKYPLNTVMCSISKQLDSSLVYGVTFSDMQALVWAR